ncbi:MAG: hypothetical protein CMJ77_04740 [Planctomycetaceae bacterium]|nr:hypothetical protein [Planctomycetaceae bacterium]
MVALMKCNILFRFPSHRNSAHPADSLVHEFEECMERFKIWMAFSLRMNSLVGDRKSICIDPR